MIGWILAMAVWTGFGLIWWAMSFVMVWRRWSEDSSSRREDRRSISIFKPVAGPLGSKELAQLRHCLESFVADLDDQSEILIGVTQADRSPAMQLIREISGKYPSASLKLIVHSNYEEYHNHKVAVMKALARHANGELWFWSDADMEAPKGTLKSLRQDFATDGTSFVTSPYIVRRTSAATDVFDQLFVNLEFYPGAVLLGRMDLIGFGFGSGLLFEASRFRHDVDWDFLGNCLADDYQLGRLLGHGRLGKVSLATVPGPNDWGTALLHYLRWHKTIRWCRPASYAAELMVLPIVGGLLSVICFPFSSLSWYALGSVVAFDVIAAYAVCRVLASPLPLRYLPAVAAWSVLRGFVWMACWLPWPIVWRGEKWWSPRLEWSGRAAELNSRPHGRS